jgi:hypothetical protein
LRGAATPKPLPRVARPRLLEEEYGGIEYGGLPVNYSVFAIRVCHSLFRG